MAYQTCMNANLQLLLTNMYSHVWEATQDNYIMEMP